MRYCRALVSVYNDNDGLDTGNTQIESKCRETHAPHASAVTQEDAGVVCPVIRAHANDGRGTTLRTRVYVDAVPLDLAPSPLSMGRLCGSAHEPTAWTQMSMTQGVQAAGAGSQSDAGTDASRELQELEQTVAQLQGLQRHVQVARSPAVRTRPCDQGRRKESACVLRAARGLTLWMHTDGPVLEADD